MEGYIVANTKDKKKLIKVIDDNEDIFFVPKEKVNTGHCEPEPEIEELKEITELKEIEELKYSNKSKENNWLSTFNIAEPFKYNGIEYSNVENAFQAHKVHDNDEKVDEYRMALSTNIDDVLTPKLAQTFGGKASFKENGFTLREDWDKVKLKIMKDIIEEYYLSNKKYLEKLMQTKDKKLVYMDSKDNNYWGTGKNGGENNHGKILMELRERLSL